MIFRRIIMVNIYIYKCNNLPRNSKCGCKAVGKKTFYSKNCIFGLRSWGRFCSIYFVISSYFKMDFNPSCNFHFKKRHSPCYEILVRSTNLTILNGILQHFPLWLFQHGFVMCMICFWSVVRKSSCFGIIKDFHMFKPDKYFSPLLYIFFITFMLSRYNLVIWKFLKWHCCKMKPWSDNVKK